MWQVDFIDKYEINRVVIHTRADEDADMIDGAQVRLGKICMSLAYTLLPMN